MSKIKVVEGRFTDECVLQNNLTENQLKFPAIKEVIQHAEQRQLSTLIVSGFGKTDQSIGQIKSKLGTIPKDKLIGDTAYKYAVQGRIQQASVILGQVGASEVGGVFSLRMRDNYLTPGMVARFYDGTHARVQGLPTGSEGNWVYNFQTLDGSTFDFATSVSPQNGTKTCFGSYSTFPEKSKTGYGRTHAPEMFVNHLTIQRKTIAISGSAASDVIWVHYGETRGWYFKIERDAKLQMMMEDEYQKWFGTSTMKNTDGTLKEQPDIFDPDTGNPVIAGDGIIPQIDGVNTIEGSGSNGEATIDDIIDLMTTLEKRSNAVMNKVWYVVTGTDGYANFNSLMRSEGASTYNITYNIPTNTAAGGSDVTIGSNFFRFNVNGNQIVLIKHPLFDDEERFTERGSDGKILQSSMMVFLDMAEVNGTPNIEILGKGAHNIDRTMLSQYLNGMSGMNLGNVVSGVDALEYHMLKDNGIFIYNTRSCGLIKKANV